MRKFALIAAAALVTAATAVPASARDYCDTHRCSNRGGPVGAAADTAAGIAGAAIGTAGAIATAPFRDSRDSYAYDRGYGSGDCRPGTWIRGEDGRRYRCR